MKPSNSFFDFVKYHAPGRWDDILNHFAGEAYGDALAKIGKHVTCPFCGEANKSGFRLKQGFADNGRSYCSCKSRSGMQLLTELQGLFADRTEANREVATYLGWRSMKSTDGVTPADVPKYTGPTPTEREAERIANLNKPEKVQKRIDSLRSHWLETMALSHPAAHIARHYLRSRGLLLPKWMDTPLVRFHAGLPYYDEDAKFVGTFPAIVFLVKAAGLDHPQAVHKIYLTSNGEKVSTLNSEWTAKKSSPYVVKEHVKGIGIPLYTKKGCTTLNVAEGQETAWAVALITGETTFSAIDAGKLENVVPGREIKKVRIWADKDRSMAGQNAAVKLANRLLGEGYEVEIMLPNYEIPEGMKGIDWLDIWASIPVEKIKKCKNSQERMDRFFALACPKGLQLRKDSSALESLLVA